MNVRTVCIIWSYRILEGSCGPILITDDCTNHAGVDCNACLVRGRCNTCHKEDEWRKQCNTSCGDASLV